MFTRRTSTFLSLLWLLAAGSRAAYIGGSDTAPGLHAAGLLGNYAGQLSAGKALSELELDKSDTQLEAHDFSDASYASTGSDAAGAAEHLDTISAGLDTHNFPADYGSDATHTVEYAEADAEGDADSHSDGDEATAEASEIHELGHELGHEHYDTHSSLGYDHGDHGDHVDFSDDHGDISHYNELSHNHYEELQLHHDDFDSKPVPGIDHGKGAFSYSTLYEFKDKL